MAIRSTWNLRQLKGLNLAGSGASDQAIRGVGSCIELRSLDLSATRVSDRGAEILVSGAIRVGQRLLNLCLRSCKVTNEALVRLASLKGLLVLDLYGTAVTVEGAAFLKEALPDCRIFVNKDKGGGPKLWRVPCWWDFFLIAVSDPKSATSCAPCFGGSR